MSVQIGENYSNNLISTIAADSKSEEAQKQNESKDTTTIFAGDLNLGDSVEETRQKAGKEAIKKLLDAFAGDEANESVLNEKVDYVASLKSDNDAHQKEINDLDEQISSLKDQYGITDDMDPSQNAEYMEAIKPFEERKAYEQEQIDDNKNEVQRANYSIRTMKVDLLKGHAMVDARNAADQILADASDTLKGMLLGEAKDHLDDQAQEVQDKIEENQKEEQAQQKADNETDTSQMQNIVSADMTQDKLQQEIKNIMNEQQLLPEDIKGVAVDQSL